MNKNCNTFTDVARFLSCAVLLCACEGRFAQADEVTIVSQFQADKGPGYRKSQPDAAGAVGPKHTVVLDDRGFVVQDKATGKVLQDFTQHDFWLKVEPTGTFDLQANDPRMLYDPITQRWFAW